MGATVFNRARAWSKTLSSGQVVYLWEENTHCIKDGPKHASWCAMKFGDRKKMLERIYALATSIPGGMLKVRNRGPVKFVMDMLDVLQTPSNLGSDSVSMGNTKGDFYSAITDTNRQAAFTKLSSIGRPDLAERISRSKEEGGEGSVPLDICADFEVITTLANDFQFEDGTWGIARGVPIWKLFRGQGNGYEDNVGPVDHPQDQLPASKPDVLLYRSGIDTRYTGSTESRFVHVMTLDGRVVFVGSNDYGMDVTMIEISADKHVKEGVLYIKHAFKAMEKARAEVSELPSSVEFRFHNPSQSKWYRENFDAISTRITGEVREDFTATHEQLAALGDEVRNMLRILFEGVNHGSCKVDIGLEVAREQPLLV